MLYTVKIGSVESRDFSLPPAAAVVDGTTIETSFYDIGSFFFSLLA